MVVVVILLLLLLLLLIIIIIIIIIKIIKIYQFKKLCFHILSNIGTIRIIKLTVSNLCLQFLCYYLGTV